MKYNALLELRRTLKTHPRFRLVSDDDTHKGNTYYAIIEDRQSGSQYRVHSRLEWSELQRRVSDE